MVRRVRVGDAQGRHPHHRVGPDGVPHGSGGRAFTEAPAVPDQRASGARVVTAETAGDSIHEPCVLERRTAGVGEELQLVAHRADHEVDAARPPGPECVERRPVDDVAVVDRVERHEPGLNHRRHERRGLRPEDRVDRERSEPAEVGAFHPEMLEERAPHERGRVEGQHLRLAALDDRPAERVTSPGRDAELQDRARARGLAEHRDPLGVAAERVDALAHPAQRGELVEEAAVRRRVTVVERHEAQRAEAVVDRDDHRPRLRGEPCGVVDGLRRAAGDERAAVDPHEHGAGTAGFAGFAGGGPDVEGQAVLGEPGRVRPEAGQRCRQRVALRRGRTERKGGPDPGPRRGRFGRAPPPLAHGRRGVGDPEEPVDRRPVGSNDT